jgi:hypothetical protein
VQRVPHQSDFGWRNLVHPSDDFSFVDLNDDIALVIERLRVLAAEAQTTAAESRAVIADSRRLLVSLAAVRRPLGSCLGGELRPRYGAVSADRAGS